MATSVISADTIACCLGQSTNYGCICPPDIQDKVLSDYCSLSDYGIPRVVSSRVCRDWVRSGVADKRIAPVSVLKKACNNLTALTDDTTAGMCKDLCRQSKGQCDEGAAAYCKLYPNDDFCKCIVLPVDGRKFNPRCFWSPCRDSTSAYSTYNQWNPETCQDIMDCSVYLNIDKDARDNIVNNVKMEQTCVQNKYVGGANATTKVENSKTNATSTLLNKNATTPQNTTTTKKNNAAPVNSANSSKKKLYIGISITVLVFIFIIIIAIIIATRTPDRHQYHQQYPRQYTQYAPMPQYMPMQPQYEQLPRMQQVPSRLPSR